MLIKQGVDFLAVHFGRILETQERTDFAQGHVQRTTVTDETKSADVGISVDAVIRFGAASVRQKAFPLVMPDCFHLRSSRFGQITDLHKSTFDPADISLATTA
jgi:hypothetical protein